MEWVRRMKNSQDEHRMMIDAIPMMAWCSLPDGSVQFLNQPWLDFTGLSLQGALGWKWRAAIHPDDLEGLIDPWRGMLASGQPVRWKRACDASTGSIAGFCSAQRPCVTILATSSTGTE
jgi:PAS domain-containing protein